LTDSTSQKLTISMGVFAPPIHSWSHKLKENFDPIGPFTGLHESLVTVLSRWFFFRQRS
jgi:hypothetical protein